MSPEWVSELARQAMWVAVLLGGPFMAAALAIGLVVSILQAATQINEMTLTFVPKIVGIGAVLWGLSGWLLQHWLTFAQEIIGSIETVGQLP
ncbi:flagellar biosynthetic protein FliQ [Persicimonas caeni]|jgi:flagellar biosynthetic protein FliQ|uniref:Flagellar biosynthetic protein FliQ n=1 Tax=Persicimonas caeni TaxID=2292766 RepID=A0A4Y6PSQ1_PERCE|nr:flagellar biosynthetic protein FliQ [Persicimonas caeni]QDG51361.1 flagellar biosynthetic protein FliQ [Persicimonas caeni]QED32582.1 flagellar biosynthetic protein FliQ [Persicimonas caeni]